MKNKVGIVCISVLLYLLVCSAFLHLQQNAASYAASYYQDARPQTYKTAELYNDLNNAERILRDTIENAEKKGEANSVDIANAYRDLGFVLILMGKPDEAEPILRRAMDVLTAVASSDNPGFADILNLLSIVGKEKSYGPEHTAVALSLDNLAGMYSRDARHAEAEQLLKRSLAIRELTYGSENPIIISSIDSLAELYCVEGKYAQAEPLLRRSLTMQEEELGQKHPDFQKRLNRLAEFYRTQGRNAEADSYLKRAAAIRKAEQATAKQNASQSASKTPKGLITKTKSSAGPIQLQSKQVDSETLLITYGFPYRKDLESSDVIEIAEIRKNVFTATEKSAVPLDLGGMVYGITGGSFIPLCAGLKGRNSYADAVGSTWVFAKAGMSFILFPREEGANEPAPNNPIYLLTTTAKGATIKFAKQGVMLKGFSIKPAGTSSR